MDATQHCISEHGLSNTTLAKVAKVAGLSAGIVNFYFQSKQQLLVETLRTLSREYETAMALAFEFSNQPAEILSDVIRAHFDAQICTPQKIAVWYAFAGESSARRDYLAICRQHDEDFQASLLAVVTRLVHSAGEPKCNAMALSRGLEGLMDGYWQDFLYDPAGFDRVAAIATCEAYLAAFFNQDARKPDSTLTADSLPGASLNRNRRTSDLLAPWTYRSGEFLDLEIAHLFKPHWLLVGHISDIPERQDYLTFDAFGEHALVVRGEDNQVRAFHNICQHRGAKLVDNARGRCRGALVCPFHGWTYHLDGRLIGVPAAETFNHLDKEKIALASLPVEIWMGFIFVRFGAPSGAPSDRSSAKLPSLAATMAPVEHLVACYQPHKMQPIADSRFAELRQCNWKVIHDIDNEGYHVANGHPALQQLYGKNYRDDAIGAIPVTYGYLNAQPGTLWSVRHYQKLLPTFAHLPAEHQRLWLYIGIFPSMVLALYPDSMEFYMTIPVDAESTRLISCGYALPDARREVQAARYLGTRINRVTNREDDDFVRRLHSGMQSSAFPQPQLSSLEHGVRGFHREIQRALPVATLATQPQAGTVARVNAAMGGMVMASGV